MRVGGSCAQEIVEKLYSVFRFVETDVEEHGVEHRAEQRVNSVEKDRPKISTLAMGRHMAPSSKSRSKQPHDRGRRGEKEALSGSSGFSFSAVSSQPGVQAGFQALQLRFIKTPPHFRRQVFLLHPGFWVGMGIFVASAVSPFLVQGG